MWQNGLPGELAHCSNRMPNLFKGVNSGNLQDANCVQSVMIPIQSMPYTQQCQHLVQPYTFDAKFHLNFYKEDLNSIILGAQWSTENASIAPKVAALFTVKELHIGALRSFQIYFKFHVLNKPR